MPRPPQRPLNLQSWYPVHSLLARPLSHALTLAEGLVKRLKLAGYQPMRCGHLDERRRPPLVAFDEHRSFFRDGDIPPDGPDPRERCGRAERQIPGLGPLRNSEPDERGVGARYRGDVVEVGARATPAEHAGVEVDPGPYRAVYQVIHPHGVRLKLEDRRDDPRHPFKGDDRLHPDAAKCFSDELHELRVLPDPLLDQV